jgi:hypothetical protein
MEPALFNPVFAFSFNIPRSFCVLWESLVNWAISTAVLLCRGKQWLLLCISVNDSIHDLPEISMCNVVNYENNVHLVRGLRVHGSNHVRLSPTGPCIGNLPHWCVRGVACLTALLPFVCVDILWLPVMTLPYVQWRVVRARLYWQTLKLGSWKVRKCLLMLRWNGRINTESNRILARHCWWWGALMFCNVNLEHYKTKSF